MAGGPGFEPELTEPWFQHPSERFAVFLKSLEYMMLEKRPRETRRPFAPGIQGFGVSGSQNCNLELSHAHIRDEESYQQAEALDRGVGIGQGEDRWGFSPISTTWATVDVEVGNVS